MSYENYIQIGHKFERSQNYNNLYKLHGITGAALPSTPKGLFTEKLKKYNYIAM